MRKSAVVFVVTFVMMMAVSLGVFAQSGVIREISGTVELKPANAAAFVAAKVGDQVAQDTVVSTGFKSTALIEVGSSVLALRPLTRLTLKEISASSEAEALNVNLQAGRVRVDVNPPAGSKASVSVSSPNATASVRGTSFDMDTRSVSVAVGVVDFSGSGTGGVDVGIGIDYD